MAHTEFTEYPEGATLKDILERYRKDSHPEVIAYCENFARIPLNEALVLLAYQIAHSANGMREIFSILEQGVLLPVKPKDQAN